MVLCLVVIPFFVAFALGVTSPQPYLRAIFAASAAFFAWLLIVAAFDAKRDAAIYFTRRRLIVRGGLGEFAIEWDDIRRLVPVSPTGKVTAYLVQSKSGAIAVSGAGAWFLTLGRRRAKFGLPAAGLEGNILLIPLVLWCQDQQHRAQIGTDAGRRAFHETLRR